MGQLGACPICGSPGSRPASGDGDNMRICGSCGVVFNAAHRPLPYNRDYFVDDYKTQYGKTYAEDAPAIRALSARRLGLIFNMLQGARPRSSLRLLDIGSAMGFFLKEASDQGIGHVEGVEISSFAADFCRAAFNIPVHVNSFEEACLSGPYDIITAWYFLEHCYDPAGALKKISSLLAPGGVLALSTPSVFGPLYRFDRVQWYRTHPGDHRVDFSPATMRSFLAHNGFRRIRIRAGGIHPERVLSAGSLLYGPFAALYAFLSDLMAFSDTMEAFALKLEN